MAISAARMSIVTKNPFLQCYFQTYQATVFRKTFSGMLGSLLKNNFQLDSLVFLHLCCSTCMSTVLFKTNKSCHVLSGNQTLLLKHQWFQKWNSTPKRKARKDNDEELMQKHKKVQQFEVNCSAFWAKWSAVWPAVSPNCSAVSHKLLSSLTAEQFGQTAQQFPPNCSAVW